jgi:hypothetical protein
VEEPVAEESRKAQGKERQVVVSVRFPAALLEWIHAVAAVEGITANTVIRNGMDVYLQDRVASPAFQQASESYLAQAQAQVATARGLATSESERAHA